MRTLEDIAAEAAAMSKEEFCARFKARMLFIAGERFDDGGSVAEYADNTAPTYFDNPDQRSDGPEYCAETDVSYWED